ncbi:hypothetical protein V8C86DRAFT_3100971 [Haematococcus lacustris]
MDYTIHSDNPQLEQLLSRYRSIQVEIAGVFTITISAATPPAAPGLGMPAKKQPGVFNPDDLLSLLYLLQDTHLATNPNPIGQLIKGNSVEGARWRDTAGKGQVRPLSFSSVYGDVITPMRDAEGRYLELTYTHPITQQLRGLTQSAGSRTYLGIQSRWLGGGRRSREPVWLADIKDPIPGNPARTVAVTLAENFNTTGLHYTPDQGAFTLRAVVAMAKPSTMQDIPGANVLHDIQSAATDALVQARVATTGQLDYLKAVKDARAQVAQAAEETLEPEAPGGWGLRVPVQSDEMQPLPPSAPTLPSSAAAPPPPTWGTSGKGKSLPPHAPAKASRGPTPAAQARGFPPGGRGNGSRGGSSRGNSSRGNSSRGSSGSLGDFDNLTIDTGTLALPQEPEQAWTRPREEHLAWLQQQARGGGDQVTAGAGITTWKDAVRLGHSTQVTTAAAGGPPPCVTPEGDAETGTEAEQPHGDTMNEEPLENQPGSSGDTLAQEDVVPME